MKYPGAQIYTPINKFQKFDHSVPNKRHRLQTINLYDINGSKGRYSVPGLMNQLKKVCQFLSNLNGLHLRHLEIQPRTVGRTDKRMCGRHQINIPCLWAGDKKRLSVQTHNTNL